ncbi:MAG: hypothetical protein QOD32_213 [Pyrinomonadaceae bacterium]|nr:hypothetical protein [Pyrinomonadaceae bacterium]
MGGEKFSTRALCLAGRDFQPSGSDPRKLLGFEKINLTLFEHLDHIGREIEQPQIMLYETREGDVRRCFTVKDVLQSCNYAK